MAEERRKKSYFRGKREEAIKVRVKETRFLREIFV